jgi:hypothetical protein
MPVAYVNKTSGTGTDGTLVSIANKANLMEQSFPCVILYLEFT